MKTPGRVLHRMAAKYFPADTCERFLDPQLADFQYEFARADGRLARVVVLVRGYAAFCIALLACVPAAVIFAVFTVIYYTSWGGFHLYAHMSYAAFLLAQVMRRKAVLQA